MKTLHLSDEAASLLLVLLSANRDVLHAMMRHNFLHLGDDIIIRHATAEDLRMADELKLTSKLIKMLEES